MAVTVLCRRCGEALTPVLSRLREVPDLVELEDGVGYEPTVDRGFVVLDPHPVATFLDGSPADSPGCFVVHPEDGAGLVRHPEARRNSGCCGNDGLDGPNRRCPSCEAEVATLRDDCWSRVEMRFEPDAVRLEAT